jgi:hypothetical protein
MAQRSNVEGDNKYFYLLENILKVRCCGPVHVTQESMTGLRGKTEGVAL